MLLEKQLKTHNLNVNSYEIDYENLKRKESSLQRQYSELQQELKNLQSEYDSKTSLSNQEFS